MGNSISSAFLTSSDQISTRGAHTAGRRSRTRRKCLESPGNPKQPVIHVSRPLKMSRPLYNPCNHMKRDPNGTWTCPICFSHPEVLVIAEGVSQNHRNQGASPARHHKMSAPQEVKVGSCHVLISKKLEYIPKRDV